MKKMTNYIINLYKLYKSQIIKIGAGIVIFASILGFILLFTNHLINHFTNYSTNYSTSNILAENNTFTYYFSIDCATYPQLTSNDSTYFYSTYYYDPDGWDDETLELYMDKEVCKKLRETLNKLYDVGFWTKEGIEIRDKYNFRIKEDEDNNKYYLIVL